ncbi:protein of unknown function [Cyanobium sp. NIES-981]|nr:protein of unknown function [Cyanobium sp. NIES-981]
MGAELVVVAAVVVVEHLAAGGGPVGRSDGLQGHGGALGTEPAGDAAGGLRQGVRVLHPVDAHQLVHPFFQGTAHLQHGGLLHLTPEGRGNAATPHLGTLGLQPDLCGSLQGREGGGQAVLEVLAAGLGRQTQTAEAAAAVVGQPLQIHHGRAPGRQRQQQVGLAGAGAPPEQTQGPGLVEAAEHPAAEGLVAPLQEQGGEGELLRQPGHAGAAHAPPPAGEAQGETRCLRGDAGQVARHRLQARAHQGQAPQHGGLPARLLVEGADLGPLGITEQRQVARSGDVSLPELRRAAHIEERPPLSQEGFNRLPEGHGARGLHAANPLRPARGGIAAGSHSVLLPAPVHGSPGSAQVDRDRRQRGVWLG